MFPLLENEVYDLSDVFIQVSVFMSIGIINSLRWMRTYTSTNHSDAYLLG
jgi:hypothetical protein